MEINNTHASKTTYPASNAPATGSKTTPPAPADDKNDAAVYEPGEKTVEKPNLSASDIQRMIDETNRQTESLRELILKMFNNQAEKNGLAKGTEPFLDPDELIDIDPETRAKAQEDIAEGGYYSVENTGDRIFNFALAISGNDPVKLEKMRKATEAGFKQAEQQWGEKLPQISYDTMDYVRNKFDEKFKEFEVK